MILELVQVDDALLVALPVALRGPCRLLRGAAWRAGAEVLDGDELVLHFEAWPTNIWPLILYELCFQLCELFGCLQVAIGLGDVSPRRCLHPNLLVLAVGLASAPSTT